MYMSGCKDPQPSFVLGVSCICDEKEVDDLMSLLLQDMDTHHLPAQKLRECGSMQKVLWKKVYGRRSKYVFSLTVDRDCLVTPPATA